MFDNEEKKNSFASTASDILNKVNKAISGKKEAAKAAQAEKDSFKQDDAEFEDDVLELLEEAPEISNIQSDSSQNIAESEISNMNFDPLKSFENGMLNLKSEENLQTKTNNSTEEKNMKEKIISETTAETTAALFNQLKQTAKTKQSSESLKFRSGTTVEDIIVELVRPHLKEWLDQHLPSVVKAAVEKEVKKLIPNEE
jgi:cell pole-organizing protein PopZ